MDAETDRLRWELADALASEQIARTAAQSAMDALKNHRLSTQAAMADVIERAGMVEGLEAEIAVLKWRLGER